MEERQIATHSAEETQRLGEQTGRRLRGGETIELAADVGGGKTEFIRGMATGMGSRDVVASPTFTISRIYNGANCVLHHFDFYRLDDPGLIRAELAESLADASIAVAVEWSDVIEDVLPASRLRVELHVHGRTSRQVVFQAMDVTQNHLLEEIP